MVLRVDHLGEAHFTSDAALIDTSNSTLLDRVDCPQIDDVPVFLWRAPTGAPWDPITYWIGAEGLVVAFATVRPLRRGRSLGSKRFVLGPRLAFARRGSFGFC